MQELKSITDIQWDELLNRAFTPSPEVWSDQVLYCIVVDRFSDGNESMYRDTSGVMVTTGTTPPFDPSQKNGILESEQRAAAWRAAGDTFSGGTIKGIHSKLGYLRRLGITTLWLTPVLKQACYDKTTYHGYGTQDFLHIDPHFGTTEDLKALVDAAHALGMYVIVDIILNHSGNVFSYDAVDQSKLIGPVFKEHGMYPVLGFNDENGKPTLPFAQQGVELAQSAWPNGAIWPRELQSPDTFTRRGAIDQYEQPDQFLYGDFMKLKDIDLGGMQDGEFVPSNALQTLVKVYQYWLACADLDGFRLDAVKHMEIEAVKFFVKEIQNFAKKLGKHNFYITGEVAGGRARALEMMQKTDLNAIVAVDDVPGSLEAVAKGRANPAQYFEYFIDEHDHCSSTVGDLTCWDNTNVVTIYDDHDQIRNGFAKARFAAGDRRWQLLELNALALLVTTVGIPCVYYGSEQAFDGSGDDDNYIRECMFGGPFGPFRSTNGHTFNEESDIYKQLSRLLTLRKTSLALRRGTQQLLQISGDGQHFGVPKAIGGKLIGVIPWLRINRDDVMLCAMNTDVENQQTVSVFMPEQYADREWRCVYSSDSQMDGAEFAKSVITVPKHGCVVYQLV